MDLTKLDTHVLRELLPKVKGHVAMTAYTLPFEVIHVIHVDNAVVCWIFVPHPESKQIPHVAWMLDPPQLLRVVIQNSRKDLLVVYSQDSINALMKTLEEYKNTPGYSYTRYYWKEEK